MNASTITVTFMIDPGSRLNEDTPVFLKTRDGALIGKLSVHHALTVTLPRSRPYFKCGLAFSLELFKLHDFSASPQTVTLLWNGHHWSSREAEHLGAESSHRSQSVQGSGSRWARFFFLLAAIAAVHALFNVYRNWPEQGGLSTPLGSFIPIFIIFLDDMTVAIALFAIGELASRVHQLESQQSKR